MQLNNSEHQIRNHSAKIDLEKFDIQHVEDYFRMISLYSAAEELNIFSSIENGCNTPESIASKEGLAITTVRQLMNGLLSFGMFLETSQGLKFSPSWAELLNKHGRKAFKGKLDVSLNTLERWKGIPSIARNECAGKSYEDEMFNSGQHLERYLIAVRETNRKHAEWLAQYLDIKGYIPKSEGLLLDIGGGHGLYAFEILRNAPLLKAIIVDLSKTLEVFSTIGKSDPMFSRTTMLSCDVSENEINTLPANLILMNDLLHSFSAEQKVSVLKKVSKVLMPEGTLIISKFKYNDPALDRDKALFSMKLHVNSNNGYLEKDAEMLQILKDSGFDVIDSAEFEEKITFFARLH
ncbi:MAG: class I SAM-dependent methyltransferase [Pseudomonadota bacterium]